MRGQRLLRLFALTASALAVSCFALPSRLAAAEPHVRSVPLSAKLIAPEEIAGAPLVDALLGLAQREHIPMGIEYLDRPALTAPLRVRVPAGTLARALSLILAQAPGYSWSERYGAIIISHDPLPAGTAALLGTLVPAFDAPRGSTLDDVAGGLEMRVYFALHPKAQGWGGSILGMPHQAVLGSHIRLRNAKVEEILSRAVSGGDAAWVVLVAPQTVAEVPNSEPWKFLPYTNPPTNYSEFLRAAGVGQKAPKRKRGVSPR